MKQLVGPSIGSKSWKGTILLVHGIGGHPVRTWSRASVQPWFERLTHTFQGLSVVSIDLSYADRRVSETKLCRVLSQRLSDEIMSSGVLDREIWIVGYSLGGVVIKDAVVASSQRTSAFDKLLKKKLRGVVFLGVPHDGSSWAKWRLLFKLPSLRKTACAYNLACGGNFMSNLNAQYFTSRDDFDFSELDIREAKAPTMKTTFLGYPDFLPNWSLRPLGTVVSGEARMALQRDSIVVDADHFELPKFEFDDAMSSIDIIEEMISTTLVASNEFADVSN
ncbi:MAG: alpha/beta fold hydrolase [Pseudomonadota bacterium]